MEDFKFYEDKHKYFLVDIPIPSVSEIIRPIYKKVYKNIDGTALKKAADRGTRVHRAIEFISKYKLYKFGEDTAGYVRAYQKSRDDNKDWKLLNSELRTYHKSFLYGMTVDEVYKTEKGIIILAIKTTKAAHLGTWSVQLSVYKAGYKSQYKEVSDMKDRNLHVTAKAIYSYMISFAGNSSNCFPSNPKIAYDLGISEDTISKYIKQLISNGYISARQEKEKGKYSHNMYTILYSKLPIKENTHTENTDTEISEPEQLAPNNNISKNNSKSINKITKNNNIYAQNQPTDEKEGQTNESLPDRFDRFYKEFLRKKVKVNRINGLKFINPVASLWIK